MDELDNYLNAYPDHLKSGGHLNYEIISVFISQPDGLSDRERECIENHLKLCDPCRQKFQEVSGFDWSFGEQSSHEKKSIVRFLQSSDVLKYAAAAAVVMAIAVSVFLYFGNTPKESLTVEAAKKDAPKNQTDSSLTADNGKKNQSESLNGQTEKKNKLAGAMLAENFVENPLLESFIDQKYRSTTMFELISPAKGDTVKMPVEFKWRSDTKTHHYLVVLLDNRNNEVWNGSTMGSRIVVNQALHPGLYYWKLQADNDLMGVRKFYIVSP